MVHALVLAAAAATLVGATPVEDRAYVDAFCDANGLLCAGEDRDDYCVDSHPFWSEYFMCKPLSLGFDLVLHNHNVSGQMPTEIGLLTNLEKLFVERDVTDPPFTVPSEIGELAKLDFLAFEFSFGNFSAPLPSELGRLTSLSSVNFVGVGFAPGAELPPEVGQWSALEDFFMFACAYPGTFPATAGPGWSDTIVDFVMQFVVGADFDLPAFGNSPTLREYSVQSVAPALRFDDPELFHSPSLQFLTLADLHGFDGALPPSFYGSPALRNVILLLCDIEFELDERIGQLATLDSLLIQETPRVSGSIPSEIAQLDLLTTLIVADSGVGGALPTALPPLLDTFTAAGPAGFDRGACSPAPSQAGTFFGPLPDVFAERLIAGSLVSLVVTDSCVNGTLPDLAGSIGDASAAVEISNTDVHDPLPDWLLQFALTTGAERCDLRNNSFCYKPKPYALSDLACPISLDGELDECGVCEGDNSTCTDCAGVVNGHACPDLCGECNGNNTCLDCAGVPFGTHVYDACQCCGGDNSTCGIDCAGVIGGSAEPDECGVCNGDNACVDCFGKPFGSACYDACGVCGGNNATCVDCRGVVDGDYVRDLCGDCVDIDAPGYAPTCFDCAGTPHGAAVRDLCGNCPASESCDVSGMALAAVLDQCWAWLWWLALALALVGAALCAWAGVFRACCGRPRSGRRQR